MAGASDTCLRLLFPARRSDSADSPCAAAVGCRPLAFPASLFL